MSTRISAAVRLLQFGDSLLPVGSFTFSNGLESAVQLGVVHDIDTLRDFVRATLKQAAGSDGIALIAAFRGATDGDSARIDEADRAVFVRKLNEEARTMTTRMGRKLAEMATHVVGPSAASLWLDRIRSGQTPGCYPIAQALLFTALDLSEQDAFAAHQYGLASMMIAASLRLLKLHYLDAQSVLFESNAHSESDYCRVAGASIDDMAVFSPVIDVLAANHVRATVRMFMN